MRFAIFTHVQHTKRDGRYYAYAPYVREMTLWLKQVEEVEVVAPLAGSKKPPSGAPYDHRQINFTPIPAFNLLSLKNTFRALLNLPLILIRIFGTMQRADHLHLRCPGNTGLLACICQVFFPKTPKTAKYAGNWDPQARQPWTYKLQKWILSNTFLTRNIQVLVYGDWPGQTKNILPFFTASFSRSEILPGTQKAFKQPFTFLFVGNLVEGKRPLQAIKLVEKLKATAGQENSPVFLKIYGDGPEKRRLEIYCREQNLYEVVQFMGNRDLEELKIAYQQAHFLILASRSEGWPKAVAEAMFFGCIPIATPVSCVPWMLGGVPPAPEEGARVPLFAKRGMLIPVLDRQENKEQVERIIKLLQDQESMQRMSEAAKEWSRQYTVERFEGAIRGVLKNSVEQKIIETEKLSPAPFREGQNGERE